MSLVKNASLTGSAVMISRALALLRELVFASLFGATWITDAYQFAFRLPGLFRDLLAEGALSSATVAVLSQSSDSGEQVDLLRRLRRFASFASLALALVILIVATPLVQRLASSMDADQQIFTIKLFRFFSPFALFVAWAAIGSAMLNVLGSFFLPALAPAAFNFTVLVLGGGLGFLFSMQRGPVAGIWGFAVGTLAGGVAQWLILVPALSKPAVWERGRDLSLSSASASSTARFRKVLKLFAPAALALAAVHVHVYLNTLWAASLAEGSVSYINYAFQLVSVPLGLVGVALSVTSLPRFSELARDGLNESFAGALKETLEWMWVLTAPASAALMVFGAPCIALVYQHGAFSALDTAKTSSVLFFFAVGLIFFNASKLFAQALTAQHRSRALISASALGVALNLVMAFVFAPKWGASGLAFSTCVGMGAHCLALWIAVSREGKGLATCVIGGRALLAGIAQALWLGLFKILGVSSELMASQRSGTLKFTLSTLGVLALAGLGSIFIAAAVWPELRSKLRMRRIRLHS